MPSKAISGYCFAMNDATTSKYTFDNSSFSVILKCFLQKYDTPYAKSKH